MKKLDVAITRAQLVGFTVGLNEEGGIDVDVTITLLTAHGRKVTNHTIGTNSWQEENKFELPFAAIPMIQSVAKSLEEVVVQKYQEQFLALPTPLT